MPVSKADLERARTELVESRVALSEEVGADVPAPTDEQVLTYALVQALDIDPLYLDEDELQRCLVDQLSRIEYLSTTGALRRTEREESPLWDRALRAAIALDARGALAGVPPERPADDVRGWAIERITNLGGLAYREPTRALWPWLEGKAVDTLIAAGHGVVSKTALRRACAGWSWSRGTIDSLYIHAFPPPPPPPEERARQRPEHPLIRSIGNRAYTHLANNRGDQAEKLKAAARAFFGHWLDPADAVDIALLEHLERNLERRPPRKGGPKLG